MINESKGLVKAAEGSRFWIGTMQCRPHLDPGGFGGIFGIRYFHLDTPRVSQVVRLHNATNLTCGGPFVRHEAVENWSVAETQDEHVLTIQSGTIRAKPRWIPPRPRAVKTMD